MSLPSLKTVAINGGILLTLGAGAVALFKHMAFKPAEVACSERYKTRVDMNIKRENGLMTASDIQAVSAGRDVLVMENLRMIPFTDAKVPAGLSVSLKAGTSQAENERATPGGISFPWLPRAVPKNLSSACLTYSVFLPANFEFDTAGTLPGLFGASPQMGAKDGERFATHVTWLKNGGFGSHVAMTTKANFLTEFVPYDNRAALPRGAWFRIDQEVIMNTPGLMDGQVKLWIDGQLRASTKAAGLRKSADMFIQGVAVDVFFGGVMDEASPIEARARKDETVRLTPFELRWN
jgi:hypothetical protein